MKNIWKNNKKYVFVIIYIIVFTLCCIFNISSASKANESNIKSSWIFKSKAENRSGNEDTNKNNTQDNSLYKYANKYINENKKIIYKYFKDRVGIIKGQDILIGTSQKELENGYYDICISLKDSRVDIAIAKLWKDVKEDVLYDEYYIKEVSRCILDICKKEYSEDEISKMEEYILYCYLESKKENPKVESSNIAGIQIVSNVKEGIFTMSIY